MEDTHDHVRDGGQFVGSAVVAGASYGHGNTVLQLQAFSGELLDYPLADIPDPAGAAEFRGGKLRPISIKIRQGGERCSVIALTAEGPRRCDISLGTALALQRAGVYAVVEGGLKVGIPCSARHCQPASLDGAEPRPR